MKILSALLAAAVTLTMAFGSVNVEAKRLGGGPPPLEPLVQALRQQGWSAQVSGVMPAQLRCDAPWERLLQVAAHVARPV